MGYLILYCSWFEYGGKLNLVSWLGCGRNVGSKLISGGGLFGNVLKDGGLNGCWICGGGMCVGCCKCGDSMWCGGGMCGGGMCVGMCGGGMCGGVLFGGFQWLLWVLLLELGLSRDR